MHVMALLKVFDIKPKPTTVEDPQGNSPFERIYQVVQNMIKIKYELNKNFESINYIDLKN